MFFLWLFIPCNLWCNLRAIRYKHHHGIKKYIPFQYFKNGGDYGTAGTTKKEPQELFSEL